MKEYNTDGFTPKFKKGNWFLFGKDGKAQCQNDSYINYGGEEVVKALVDGEQFEEEDGFPEFLCEGIWPCNEDGSITTTESVGEIPKEGKEVRWNTETGLWGYFTPVYHFPLAWSSVEDANLQDGQSVLCCIGKEIYVVCEYRIDSEGVASFTEQRECIDMTSEVLGVLIIPDFRVEAK